MMTTELSIKKRIICGLAISLAAALSGCGGTKVLKEPEPLQLANILASTANEHISATLDWVIVRDGPGTWAKNSDWDEYLLTVANQSEIDIQILRVTVVDSLETRLTSDSKRKMLVKASKTSTKRYKGSGLKVKAGFGAGTMIVTGTAVAAVGVAVSYGAVNAANVALVSGGSATTVGSVIAPAAIVLIAPVLVVGGIVRSVNNKKVSNEILARHSVLPLTLASAAAISLDLFFPLAPSPGRVEIAYVGPDGKQTLLLDTSEALHGLHLVPNE